MARAVTWISLLAVVALVTIACSCAAWPKAPATADAIAQALAPMLPALVAAYQAEGQACLGRASSRAEADACLARTRTAWRLWDALQPIRGAMDDLVAIERGWSAEADRRWPELPPVAACDVAPKEPKP